ncbi:hypothetical protein ACWEV3_43335 [Saccharopolyspora sp. NPDC003752]
MEHRRPAGGATEWTCAAVDPGFTEQEWDQHAHGLPYQHLYP